MSLIVIVGFLLNVRTKIKYIPGFHYYDRIEDVIL